MLEKVCNIIFAEKKLKKIYHLSKISFFCGIILIVGLPILSRNIHIEEKHLKNTSLFSRNVGSSNFASYMESYFKEKNPNDKIYNFCQQIFQNSKNKPYNYIFSKDIISPRGKKFHLIQLNLIYDQTLKTKEIMEKSNFVFYALIRYLSDENHITWLSKDLQFNYVTKELFENHPKECFERLTKGKYNKKIEDGKIISAIYNFDLSEIDIEHLYYFLIKIGGINSELVDIDFYRMVLANFQANFKNSELYVTTNLPVLSKSTKKTITKFLDKFGDLVNYFMPKNDYINKYLYLIENILNDFLLINNKINTNHLLISNGYNSLLIKTLGKTKPQSNDRQIASYYNLLGTILIMIKGMTNEQVDLFRGLYFYLLTSPYQCIGYFYLFVLIFMFIREFYNLIDLIYHNEYKYIWTIPNPFDKKIVKIEEDNENNNNVIYASRIIATLFFVGIFYIYLMVNIEDFMRLINEKNMANAYYYMISNIFVNQLFVLSILRISKAEEKFIDIILMYLFVLNCWNFVFINIGIGMIMTAIIMTMEFIFLHLRPIKKIFIKIIFIVVILYGILGWKQLITTMVDNYINYNNNIYSIITMTIILLTLRLSLFIIMLINKCHRKEPWDYDEVIDIDENEENDEKEENKKNENKEKEIIEKEDKDNIDENNINNENEENEKEINIIELKEEDKNSEEE